MSSQPTSTTNDEPARPAESPEPAANGTTVAGVPAAGTPLDRDTGLPETTAQVVQVEESAAATAPEDRQNPLTTWLFRPDEPPHRFALAELERIVAADENFAWIDLCAYAEHDLREIAGMLDLHDVAVDAALSSWKRPRLDVFGDYFFVTATVAQLVPDARVVRAQQLDLFVGNNYLVSAHKRPLPFAERILTRASQRPELIQLDSAFMLYIILDQLLEYYEDLCEHMEDEIERMEERALTDTSDAFLGDLLHFKRYVFALSRLADQHRNVFSAFLRADFPYVSDDKVVPYYRDLEARLARLLDMLAAAKEAINGAFDIFVSHISHRTNQVMKLLTMVSTILLPVTLILGFFGTNFKGIPLYEPSGFWAMVGSIVLLVVIILAIFRRRGWF